jgi:ABC-type branched-subunit amino acid transport system ATPase component
MMFADVIKAVEQFSPEEVQALSAHLEARKQQLELRPGTVNIEALLSALDEIRAGLTDEQFAEIERAMNELNNGEELSDVDLMRRRLL